MENQTDNLTTETRRTSAADRLEMVGRFHRSGKTRRAFCESEGIAKSTLDWWLRKSKGHSRSRKKRVAFREVALVSTGNEAISNWAMEVVSPQGWTIRSRQALRVEDMARLLGEA
jgi:transposase-like protein